MSALYSKHSLSSFWVPHAVGYSWLMGQDTSNVENSILSQLRKNSLSCYSLVQLNQCDPVVLVWNCATYWYKLIELILGCDRWGCLPGAIERALCNWQTTLKGSSSKGPNWLTMYYSGSSIGIHHSQRHQGDQGRLARQQRAHPMDQPADPPHPEEQPQGGSGERRKV